MVANQPSRRTRRPAGPSTRSRGGLLESQSAMPSMILLTGPPCSSRATTRPGSSAAGSADRGHQAPSGSAQAGSPDCMRSRGMAGGVGLIAVRVPVVDIILPSLMRRTSIFPPPPPY